MASTFSKFLNWNLLNVGLPAVAAGLTYSFAHLTVKSKSLDEVMVKAFAGGDNLIVAAIMFVVLFYETESLEARSGPHWLRDAARALFFVAAVVFFVCFGAFKFYSFTTEPDAGLNYAGATISIAALFSSCVFSTVVKACLVIFWSEDEP